MSPKARETESVPHTRPWVTCTDRNAVFNHIVACISKNHVSISSQYAPTLLLLGFSWSPRRTSSLFQKVDDPMRDPQLWHSCLWPAAMLIQFHVRLSTCPATYCNSDIFYLQVTLHVSMKREPKLLGRNRPNNQTYSWKRKKRKVQDSLRTTRESPT